MEEEEAPINTEDFPSSECRAGAGNISGTLANFRLKTLHGQAEFSLSHHSVQSKLLVHV